MSPVAAFKPATEPLTAELEELFLEHSRLVYRTAYRVTGSPQDAEDVVQTLFLQLLRRGLPPGLGKNPKAYLYRAAINLALNAVKSRRRRASAADPAHLERAADVPDEAHVSNPRVDLQERLVDAIAQLNPRAVEMLIRGFRAQRRPVVGPGDDGYGGTRRGRRLGRSPRTRLAGLGQSRHLRRPRDDG